MIIHRDLPFNFPYCKTGFMNTNYLFKNARKILLIILLFLLPWPVNSQVMLSYSASKNIYNRFSFLKLKLCIYSKSSLIFGSFLFNLEDQTTLMKQQMQTKVFVHHGVKNRYHQQINLEHPVKLIYRLMMKLMC